MNGRRAIRTLLGTAALLALFLSAGTAQADGGRDHRNADNTFTKWLVDSSTGTMAGVVGGDVGDGSYAGQILDLEVTSTGLVIDAMYHFNGSRHSFSALVHVVQTGFVDGSTGVISGRVTDGWLGGNEVAGTYTQIACGQAPSGSCFAGTLAIQRGSKD
jgi:hypothetical protein